MSIGLKILDSDRVIEKRILEAIARHFDKVFNSLVPILQKKVPEFTRDFFRGTDTFHELIRGDLKGHFGFKTTSKPEIIVDLISEDFEIIKKPVKVRRKQFVGGIDIKLVRSGFKNILESDAASIITEKDDILDWLDWLLTKGFEIIIDTHHVFFKEGVGQSGMAIMSEGGVWRVPPPHGGTIDDNWITRTLRSKSYLSGLSSIIQNNMKRLV